MKLDWPGRGRLNARRGARRPQDQPEVYAEQAVWIHEHPEEEIVLQAIRIGELGMTAIPNEVYGGNGTASSRPSRHCSRR